MFMPETRPTAIVYIDGLNLYRFIKSTFPGNQRVDIATLCGLLFPSVEIIEIQYFTAFMKSLDGNPDANIRQRNYLNELTSRDSRITIQFGHIRVDTRVFPKAPKQVDEDGKFTTARVYKFEEKETDVRIACTMTADVAQSLAECYYLISGDTDFKPLIEMVRERFDADAKQLSMPSISRQAVMQSQLSL
jgi:uncharacterized LabA/DUF88 family protein